MKNRWRRVCVCEREREITEIDTITEESERENGVNIVDLVLLLLFSIKYVEEK